jgi:hypothetical protein
MIDAREIATATSISSSTRSTSALERLLTALLGLIWLADGVLQLQSAISSTR